MNFGVRPAFYGVTNDYPDRQLWEEMTRVAHSPERMKYYMDRTKAISVEEFITILAYTMPDGPQKKQLLNLPIPPALLEISAGALFNIKPQTIQHILHKNTDGNEKQLFAAKLVSKFLKLDATSILKTMANSGFTVPHVY